MRSLTRPPGRRLLRALLRSPTRRRPRTPRPRATPSLRPTPLRLRLRLPLPRLPVRRRAHLSTVRRLGRRLRSVAGSEDHLTSGIVARRDVRPLFSGSLVKQRRTICIPPRDSGEGGPRSCAVGGALDSTLLLALQDFPHRPRPLHHASHGPPSPLSRGRMRDSIPAMRFASEFLFKRHESFASNGREAFHFYLPWKTREAERRTAHLRYPHLKEMQARSFATARLSALLRGYPLRFVTPTRPGPRFLESPDANGRTLSDASAAGILQSDHAPDGAMPKPLANKSDWLSSARTAPAPSIGVTGRCP